MLGAASQSTNASASLVKEIYGLIAGILRRYTGSSLKGVFVHLLKGPANAEIGHVLARGFDVFFRPHECLTKEFHAIIKPLWSQKAYIQLVKPMLPLAWPKKSGNQASELVLANYSIAILSSIRHLEYTIYQDDAADLVRLILCVLRNLPVGVDVETALRVLETITKESTNVLEPFLNSTIDSCTSIITSPGPQPGDRRMVRVSARCRNLAILLLGYLPGRYEDRHLLGSVPRMERLLSVACGDRVREVRKTALATKLVWANVK